MTFHRLPIIITGSPEAICVNCRWWILDDEADIGSCRRRAPIETGKVNDLDYEYQAIWPWTFESDWCGEWQPKLQPADTEPKSI